MQLWGKEIDRQTGRACCSLVSHLATKYNFQPWVRWGDSKQQTPKERAASHKQLFPADCIVNGWFAITCLNIMWVKLSICALLNMALQEHASSVGSPRGQSALCHVCCHYVDQPTVQSVRHAGQVSSPVNLCICSHYCRSCTAPLYTTSGHQCVCVSSVLTPELHWMCLRNNTSTHERQTTATPIIVHDLLYQLQVNCGVVKLRGNF